MESAQAVLGDRPKKRPRVDETDGAQQGQNTSGGPSYIIFDDGTHTIRVPNGFVTAAMAEAIVERIGHCRVVLVDTVPRSASFTLDQAKEVPLAPSVYLAKRDSEATILRSDVAAEPYLELLRQQIASNPLLASFYEPQCRLLESFGVFCRPLDSSYNIEALNAYLDTCAEWRDVNFVTSLATTFSPLRPTPNIASLRAAAIPCAREGTPASALQALLDEFFSVDVPVGDMPPALAANGYEDALFALLTANFVPSTDREAQLHYEILYPLIYRMLGGLSSVLHASVESYLSDYAAYPDSDVHKLDERKADIAARLRGVGGLAPVLFVEVDPSGRTSVGLQKDTEKIGVMMLLALEQHVGRVFAPRGAIASAATRIAVFGMLVNGFDIEVVAMTPRAANGQVKFPFVQGIFHDRLDNFRLVHDNGLPSAAGLQRLALWLARVHAYIRRLSEGLRRHRQGPPFVKA